MTTTAQGEVYARRIDQVPEGLTPLTPENGRIVVAHAESGHHHYLDADDVEVMERPDASEGVRVLYAIVRNPTALRQSAATPHDAMPMEPGIYELRTRREFDPFAEVARRVAD